MRRENCKKVKKETTINYPTLKDWKSLTLKQTPKSKNIDPQKVLEQLRYVKQ